MARWRLTEAHYIKGHLVDEDKTEWEYKEADRMTGREKRKRFEVPDYRDVDTIVCYEGSEKDKNDFVMDGPPTPGMEPIDDEAREISAKHASSWKHPIETLPAQFGPETLQMMTAFAQAATPVAASGVSKEDFDKVMARLNELEAKNASLEAAALPKAQSKSKDLRI